MEIKKQGKLAKWEAKRTVAYNAYVHLAPWRQISTGNIYKLNHQQAKETLPSIFEHNAKMKESLRDLAAVGVLKEWDFEWNPALDTDIADYRIYNPIKYPYTPRHNILFDDSGRSGLPPRSQDAQSPRVSR
ncbi:hypothetical protein BJ875DRAFT_483116 [Amylocarpus encephaloides]|uniref:Uncharacterized protein n=1 Tax=Amylocarpus encephaloides TaxID=45428 RepID=A0A9P8C6Q5_9HELO|nr:hypothetical protein BJ875DRAFT_483116 [Amylocarpus encephaloides]